MGVYGTTIITGATPVVNGTSGRILYNNSNAVGEFGTWDGTTLTITGSVEALPGGMGRGILNAAYGTSRAFEAVYDAGTYWGILQMAAGNNAFGVYNEFVKTRSTNGTTMAAVSTNDTVMVLNSYADSGTAIPFVARLYTSVTGAVGGTNWPGMFGVRLGTGSGTADHTFTPTVFTSPGSVVATTTMTTGAASGTTGAVLFKGTTSGTVTLSVADAAGTYTLKLPTTDGNAGEFLQTDGSGNTTWAVAGSGGLTVGTTTITSGTNGRILYDNSGVLGEATVTGTLGSVVLSTAPTLTGPVTISEAVGSGGLTITGATQTTSQPALNITQTWNAAGVKFFGPTISITNTASAGTANNTNASRVFAINAGASGTTELMWVDKFGTLFLDDSTGAFNVPQIRTNNGTLDFNTQGINGRKSHRFVYNGKTLFVNNAEPLGWVDSATDASGTFATGWYSPAVGTTEQRNGTSAQTRLLANTWTSSTNNEHFVEQWSSNVLHIRTDKGSGGGTARVLQIDYGGTTTSAVTVPAAITGTIIIADGGVGATTALQLGGASQTATSGTYIATEIKGTFAPSSTSTMTSIPLHVNPTINYSAGTPGAGGYQAIRISAVETALPTGGNYLLHANAGAAGTTNVWNVLNDGTPSYLANTAIPAGGTTGKGLKFSSTANFGVFFGSGAPSLSAAKGSLYLRSDGSGTTDRAYINTDGGTTWTALTTAA